MRHRAPRVTPLLIVALGFLSMGSAFATDVYLPAMPGVVTDLRFIVVFNAAALLPFGLFDAL